jgi:hypothetical protein
MREFKWNFFIHFSVIYSCYRRISFSYSVNCKFCSVFFLSEGGLFGRSSPEVESRELRCLQDSLYIHRSSCRV